MKKGDGKSNTRLYGLAIWLLKQMRCDLKTRIDGATSVHYMLLRYKLRSLTLDYRAILAHPQRRQRTIASLGSHERGVAKRRLAVLIQHRQQKTLDTYLGRRQTHAGKIWKEYLFLRFDQKSCDSPSKAILTTRFLPVSRNKCDSMAKEWLSIGLYISCAILYTRERQMKTSSIKASMIDSMVKYFRKPIERLAVFAQLRQSGS